MDSITRAARTKGRQAAAKKALTMYSAAKISADTALAVMVDAGLKPHYAENLIAERRRQRRLTMDRRNEAARHRRAQKKKLKETQS